MTGMTGRALGFCLQLSAIGYFRFPLVGSVDNNILRLFDFLLCVTSTIGEVWSRWGLPFSSI